MNYIKKNMLCTIGALFMIMIGIGCYGVNDTVFAKQKAKLKSESLVCKDCFDFVIVGDIQFGESFKYQPEFYSMIKDWNVVKPSMIFVIGDLILGGAAEGVDEQWDIFEKNIAKIKPPFFPLVGGHDISDKATENIYTNRIGPTRYALPYGNSLFISLDTEEVGQSPGVLSDNQLQWLKKVLSTSTAKNIFIMMHQPIFDTAGYGNNWEKIETLFKGYPVRAVFAGHKHYYRDWGVRDGVHYFISGGGGGDRIGTPENKGGFAHYILVHVRGDSVNFVGVKPGSFFASNSITQLRVSEMEDLVKRITTDPVEVTYGESLDRDVKVFIDNPYDWPLNLELKWKVPQGWHVSPEVLTVKAGPKQRGEATIHLKTDSPEAVCFPVPSFETVVPKVENGKPIKVSNKLDLIPVAYAVHAPEKVNFDGTLNDWSKAEQIPVVYAYGFDPENTKDLKSDIRIMWDEKYLYVAVDTIDNEYNQPYSGDIVWAADNVELFIDKWHWGLTLTKKGEEVFLYEAPKDRVIEVLNEAVKLSVHRINPTHIVYEAAFPLSELVPLQLKADSCFNMTMIMNDLDFIGKRHWLELTPGWGEFCTGPLIKVILKK